MDFSVKDFNVRLRTIKLWEIIIAVVISFFLTGFVEGYLNISSGELEYVLFFCFMMVFFLIATYGTTGFNKDVNDLFKASSILRVLILAISNMFVAIFIQTMFFPLDSLLNMVNSISLPLLDVVTGTNDPLLFIFEMFSAIIIAPISEELFFRGVLFNRLKIRKGFVFGFSHFWIVPFELSGPYFTCYLYLHNGNDSMYSLFKNRQFAVEYGCAFCI